MTKCDYCGSTHIPLFTSSFGGYICSSCLQQGKDPDSYRNHETYPLRQPK